MPRQVVQSGLPASDAFPHQVTAALTEDVASYALDHLVTVQRNTEGGTDDFGQPLPPVWSDHLVDVTCLALVEAEGGDSEIISEQKTVGINRRKVLVPLDTDVTSADRLSAITFKNGSTVFSGPLRIEAVNRRVAYMELIVERIEGTA